MKRYIRCASTEDYLYVPVPEGWSIDTSYKIGDTWKSSEYGNWVRIIKKSPINGIDITIDRYPKKQSFIVGLYKNLTWCTVEYFDTFDKALNFANQLTANDIKRYWYGTSDTTETTEDDYEEDKFGVKIGFNLFQDPYDLEEPIETALSQKCDCKILGFDVLENSDDDTLATVGVWLEWDSSYSYDTIKKLIRKVIRAEGFKVLEKG